MIHKESPQLNRATSHQKLLSAREPMEFLTLASGDLKSLLVYQTWSETLHECKDSCKAQLSVPLIGTHSWSLS